MSFIDSTSLVVDALSGFLALVAGPAAMFSRKGGGRHRRSGATFAPAIAYCLVPSVVGTVAIRATLAYDRRWPPAATAAREAPPAESREP